MDEWDILLDDQFGIVHWRQAIQAGISDDEIRHRVRRGSWRLLYPGVYCTFTGPLAFASRVWAALLHAGPPAMASHGTAARLQGLVDEDPGVIQVSVPNSHRVTPQRGLRVHRPRAWSDRRQPASSLPVTRLEDTVLDLVGATYDVNQVVHWVLRACQRRLTTPARLRSAAAQRRRLRHRTLVRELLDEAAGGVASPLERRYRTKVEIAHGLPRAERGQSWIGPDGVRRYFDARYRTWRVRVELEGLAFHPMERSWTDHARDNAAVLLGDVVLRYGWRQISSGACQVAAQVGAVLTLRGWPGHLVPCGIDCRAPGQSRGAITASPRNEATSRQR